MLNKAFSELTFPKMEAIQKTAWDFLQSQRTAFNDFCVGFEAWQVNNYMLNYAF